MYIPAEAALGVESPQAGDTGGCELLSECSTGTQTHPREEQQVLLLTKPFLQPLAGAIHSLKKI